MRTAAFVPPLLLAALLGCSSPDPQPVFRAGAFAADITPAEWPLPLIGNFSFRPATAAHDPLHARALVLDDGEDSLAIVVVDSCYIPRETLDEAKRRASERTGIPTDRMLVSATHTHSAPPAAPGAGLRVPGSDDLSENERAYSERLMDGIAEAIAQAQAKLEPAEIGYGVEPLPDEVHNRRWFMKEGTIPPDPFGGTTDKVKMNPPRGSSDLIRPAGPTDPDVATLAVRRLDGSPLALLADYSLHYVGGVTPGVASADYFGEFARVLPEKIGAGNDFVAILANGTSGNINNIDFTKPGESREPFEQIRKVAGKTADAAKAAYDRIEFTSDVDLEMTERLLTIDSRKPTDEGYRQAQERLKTLDPDEDVRPYVYAQRSIQQYEGPNTVEIKLQALRIGDVAAVTAIPFETFVETGLELKAKSPLKPEFTIELANGANGYLPTPEHHDLGGYETWLGTNRVEREASVKITATLLEMLDQLAR